VTTLFEKNPYGDSPMFRGFYFTSGNAEGEAVEMVVNEVSRVIGLPPDLDASDVTRVIDSLPEYDDSAARTRASASEEDADPRFLRELFTRIMLSDRGLAAPTERAVQRTKFQSLSLQIGGVLLVATLVVLMVTSFVRNRSLVSKTVEISREAALIPAGANDAGEVETRLRVLDSMRLWLEGLDQKDAHTPATMGFGLYRGKTVNQKARSVYVDRFVDVLLGPSRREFENRLLLTYPRSVEEYEAYIEDYRAYLMLVDPARADTTVVMERLNRLWASPGQVTATEGLRDMIIVSRSASGSDGVRAECHPFNGSQSSTTPSRSLQASAGSVPMKV
jgi:type VI secretion system protein ImpL